MSRGKQQFLIFLFGFLLAGILLAGGYILYSKLMDAGKLQSVSLPLQAADDLKKAGVLVSLQRIEKGEELKQEFFQLKERSVDEVPANSLVDINRITGERAAFTIDMNEVLTDSKLLSSASSYSPDDRLKDYALQGYLVADTVKAGDWIDIEMVRSNGDTFVVLAKKQVMQLTNNRAIIQVSTDERFLINHAIAEQTAGLGHIESLLYLDEKQPASTVTYTPAKISANSTQASAASAGAEPAKSEPIRSDEVKPDPVNSRSAKSDPAKSEPVSKASGGSGGRQDAANGALQSGTIVKQADAKAAQGGRTRQ
jgi:hypothetical protein